ncbi:hypothetical protein P170DRAFT_367737 [Aspergillus steynii IBT 23096]|uniref:Uncharacterized protein n=1 Tax=Aspergillus steynii IBT 23096 TaxID=1392250 RepID=A0A2I2FVK3_9EURO|nr:uncharacterized protein P170DRAFT_367737 [Aspergillus steynii IBT 23096]PLB44596.1 hypothetical protein P170DRAFT_367737 [Aspergillus steynii IBT 23096]
MAKEPERNYEDESDYETTDEEDSENEADNDDKDEGPASKARCDDGKTCLCRKPAEEHPEHAWAFTLAGRTKSFDLRLCADLRCPDMFDMYTYNDHHGYGIVQVVENLVLDFDEARDNWREQWAMCEAAVLFLLGGDADPMTQIDDGERVFDIQTLMARMFLTMLATLEARDLLKPDSEIKNLGVVMAIYMKYINCELNDGSNDTDPKFKFSQAHGNILAYAKKHGIALRGPAGTDELVEELQDEQDEINVPAKGDDPWNWAGGLKKYEKDHAVKNSGHKKAIGGDNMDITTWSVAERKEHSFNGKDCFSKKEIDALKNGLILQVR